MLWSEDYVKFNNYLEPGMVVYITGSFIQRYRTSPFEFKISSISLLESLMRTGTKKLQIEMHPQSVSQEMIEFIGENVQHYPGNATLKFCINEPTSRLKFGMYSMNKGFEMNDEMANYLQKKAELDIQIELT